MNEQGISDLLYKGEPLDEFDLESLLTDLGYRLEVQELKFTGNYIRDEAIKAIEEYLEPVAAHVVLTNEAAHREFLTAPILYAGARSEKATIRRFSPLKAGDFEARSDYWLRGNSDLLVETRHSSLEKGFAHLVVQLVMLDLRDDPPNGLATYFGAVVTNGAWRFAWMHHRTKTVLRDQNLNGVPPDVSEVFRKLVGCLNFAIPGGVGAQSEAELDPPQPSNQGGVSV